MKVLMLVMEPRKESSVIGDEDMVYTVEGIRYVNVRDDVLKGW